MICLIIVKIRTSTITVPATVRAAMQTARTKTVRTAARIRIRIARISRTTRIITNESLSSYKKAA